MNKITTLLLASIVFLSCNNNDDGLTTDRVATEIKLTTNTSLMIANGNSQPELTVNFFDENGAAIPSEYFDYEILANGISVGDNTFTTLNTGLQRLKVRYNNLFSNEVTILAREDKAYSNVSIPIVFHVVHFNEPVGQGFNLSQVEVQETLNIINDAYANRNGSTNLNAVDMKIQFRLALRNPNGGTMGEPGIHRIGGVPYDISGDQKFSLSEVVPMFDHHQWNPREYLNIWLYPSSNGKSYGLYPFVYQSYSLEGLDEVPDSCICSPENFEKGHIRVDTENRDGIIAHEIGHRLGMFHNFSENGCISADYCSDTYSYVLEGGECQDMNLGIKELDNIMDYNGIFTTFTYDQRERARHVLDHGLWFQELRNSNK
ncbi:MAG: hypothetical protein Aureis2KO_03840 [Aureisphaera sp.]